MKKVLRFENINRILEYISDGIQIVDREGLLIYCNRRSAMLDDIQLEDSLGRHILKVYPSLDEQSSTLLNVIKTGQPILNLEQKYTTYLGNEIHTVNTTLPLMDVNNNVIGAVEISKNITNVKKLSEQVIDLQKVVMGSKETSLDEHPLYRFEDIITQDDATVRMISRAMKVAQTDAPVLVYGETGTGKELIVQAIHNSGPRQDEPFIVQNCASLPESLLEGILFGTLKGGFTGSINRPGLFEIANHGTLFLDEINTMPLPLQSKILRVLQDGRFRRIGDTRIREADVRVIAAINEDPFKAIEEGRLRRDLFYRLNTITLRLNPLIERVGDVELLADFFIQKFNQKYYRQVKGMSEAVRHLLVEFHWPGNIRELEHVIESAVSLIDGQLIQMEDLPVYMRKRKRPQSAQKFNLRDRLEELESQLIDEAMSSSDQNISKAARLLGIPRQTLQYRFKRKGAEK
jgi:arginine utilization regulatory protein